MYCANCGCNLEDDAKFCANCGSIVNHVEPDKVKGPMEQETDTCEEIKDLVEPEASVSDISEEAEVCDLEDNTSTENILKEINLRKINSAIFKNVFSFSDGIFVGLVDIFNEVLSIYVIYQLLVRMNIIG